MTLLCHYSPILWCDEAPRETHMRTSIQTHGDDPELATSARNESAGLRCQARRSEEERRLHSLGGSGECRLNPRTIMDRPSEHGYAAQRLGERRVEGAEWRRQVPPNAPAEWKVLPDRPDPVEILVGQGKTWIAELLPIRYARMKADPFAFLRGAAAIMAADLASGPTTGLRVQACGDCHLANFGAYATPEGTPIFDVNDFDETLPAPFEWDVKRLAASLAVAGGVAGASDREARQLARSATKAYRRHLGQLALLSPLEAWSSRIDLAGATGDIDSPKIRRNIAKRHTA